MQKGKQPYDPQMRKTANGRRIYYYWCKKVLHNTDSKKFEEFPGFYKWAMSNGYTIGAKLFRYDPDEPFSPENCFWGSSGDSEVCEKLIARDQTLEQKWDEAVNRIRLYFGMEPIHSTEV